MAQLYKHTQKGHRVIIFGLLAVIFAASAACFHTLEKAPLRNGGEVIFYWFVATAWLLNGAFLVWLTLMISALTVVIEDGFIRIRFGTGAWRKKFALAEVISARPVKSSFWHGWGIHYTGNAWLYNVSGLDSVEITVQNGKRRRIGTDEPDKLTEAINSRLAGE